MSLLKEAALDFLAQKRIAVAGVSRKGDIPANFIYRKLRETGHEVYAVNPNTDIVEGDACYPDLSAIPVQIDAMVIATHPKSTRVMVQQCADLGVNRYGFIVRLGAEAWTNRPWTWAGSSACPSYREVVR